jgi:hypothetical protein
MEFEDIVDNSLWDVDEEGDDILMEHFLQIQKLKRFPRTITRYFVTEIINLEEGDEDGYENY